MNIKTWILYSCILLSYFQHTYTEQTTPNHTITVFVHGSFAFRKIVQYTPFRSMIYCKQGLNLAKNLPQHYFFHEIAAYCAQENPIDYNLDQFYIFGWKSEHIYEETRNQAAKKLVEEMQNLVEKYYQKHKIVPSIQLVGFSHGSNVVLNTADYLPLKVINQPVSVTIWVLGTPVQKINKDLINSPHFQKSYAIYSQNDWMQRMDPQGLRNLKFDFKNFWSDRTFSTTDSCVQAHLSVNNKPIAHSYYRYIFKYLPKIQKLVKEESHKTTEKNISINLIV